MSTTPATRGMKVYNFWQSLGPVVREWAVYGINYFGGEYFSDAIFNPNTALEMAVAKLADYAIQLPVKASRERAAKERQAQETAAIKRMDIEREAIVARLNKESMDEAQYRDQLGQILDEDQTQRSQLLQNLPSAYPAWALAASLVPNAIRIYGLYNVGSKLANTVSLWNNGSMIDKGYAFVSLFPTIALGVYGLTSIAESADWAAIANELPRYRAAIRDGAGEILANWNQRRAGRRQRGNLDRRLEELERNKNNRGQGKDDEPYI